VEALRAFAESVDQAPGKMLERGLAENRSPLFGAAL